MTLATPSPPPSRRTRALLARASLLCAAALALGPSLAAQGETGFLRGKGKTDVVLSFTRDSYDEFWIGDDKTSMAGVGEVTRDTYTLYAAHGLNDRTDLILQGSYVSTEADGTANFDDEDDFQDLALAAKWRFWERTYGNGSELSVAALPGVKLPLSDYENNAVTAVGDGQIDLRFRLVGQYRLANGAFAALETGYDKRNGAPHDEVPIHLTAGATVLRGLTLSAFYSNVNSLGGTDIGGPGGFSANEEDFQRTGLSAYYRLTDRVGFTGSWRTTIDGRNTGDVEGFSAGLVFNL